MPAIKPANGRKVWKLYCEAHGKVVFRAGPRGLMALYGGRMFASKEAADRYAFRESLRYPEYIGKITVRAYTCNGREDGSAHSMYVVNPPRRRK